MMSGCCNPKPSFVPLLRVLPADGRLPILSIGIGSGGQEGRGGGGGAHFYIYE